MEIKVRRWEWVLGGIIIIGACLEWWFKDFERFPDLLVILFWLVILRIILAGIFQLWDVLTGKHIHEAGKELEDIVTSRIADTEKQIEEFGKNFLKGKTITDYRLSHPESFEGEKFKSCHNCGDRSIWVKQMGIT
ncbi:hypothetical protein EHW61_17150, partial [Salinivibrio sp. VYel6]|uniref:hypothetical protein n=1 Tax=Salinivibrio sp. VYel6 TaxID=2490493 RepID=UPI001C12A48B